MAKKSHIDETLGVVGTETDWLDYLMIHSLRGSNTTSSSFKVPFLRLQAFDGPNSVYGLVHNGKVPKMKMQI